MKQLSFALVFIAAITGFVAAWKWFKASKVDILLPHPYHESGDPIIAGLGRDCAIMNAFSESAKLNKTAASWTALSVLFGAAYNFISLFFL